MPAAATVLIIDAESSDDTVSLARAHGAQVVVRSWEGFVETRRRALDDVRTPWTFMLDADEVLDTEALDALARATDETLAAPESAPAFDGYTILRRTYFCGRPIAHGAWGRDAPLRLFRTAVARLQAHPAGGGAADVHESWSVPGPVARLPGILHHYSYPSLAAYAAKFARYTSLEARSTTATSAGLARAFARALVRVPWLLVARGGWRDGWRGAFIALASAAYPVAVAWKARAR